MSTIVIDEIECAVVALCLLGGLNEREDLRIDLVTTRNIYCGNNERTCCVLSTTDFCSEDNCSSNTCICPAKYDAACSTPDFNSISMACKDFYI